VNAALISTSRRSLERVIDSGAGLSRKMRKKWESRSVSMAVVQRVDARGCTAREAGQDYTIAAMAFPESRFHYMASILVAEDDPALRELLDDTLVRAGHVVTVATNGAEALRLIDSTVFDLVICDLVMPEVEGLQVLREIRRKSPRPKTIAMSGGGRGPAKDYLELASVLGADATVTKPFTRQQLIDSVARVLGRRDGNG
jgi:CheY-like chemotaxis protein